MSGRKNYCGSGSFKTKKKINWWSKKTQCKKEHRAFPSFLLDLNGLILPAANLCCTEIFLPFSLDDIYYTSFLVHGMTMGNASCPPCQELHNEWSCSELYWKTNACNFSAEEINQFNCWNDLDSFGASSRVVLAETGVWKEKGGWRDKKVAAEGIIPIWRLK